MKNFFKTLVMMSLLGIVLIFVDVLNGGNVTAKKVDLKMKKEIKQEKLDHIEEEIQELQEQKTTQEIWLQEGKLLEEQAALEEELHPEEYYKQQIKIEMDTLDAAVTDMKIAIDSNNVPEDVIAETQERIQKYGEILDEYRKAYELGEYSSLEELFKQEHEKISRLHSYFEEKYN